MIEFNSTNKSQENGIKRPAFNPTVAELISRLYSTCEDIKDGEFYDFTNHLLLARQIEPSFVSKAHKLDVSHLDFLEAGSFINELSTDILIPNGAFFLLSYYDGKPQVMSASFDPSANEKLDYLGEIITTYYVDSLHSPNHNHAGFITIGNIVLIDKAFCAQDAKNYYEICNIFQSKFPTFQKLQNTLSELKIDELLYSQLFGVEMKKARGRQCVKDNVLADLKCGKDSSGHLNDKERSRAILKHDSPLRIILDKENEFNTMSFVGLVARQYSAQLGGLLSVMEQRLQNNSPELAYCSFLDFMAEMDLMRVITRDTGLASRCNHCASDLFIKALLFSGHTTDSLLKYTPEQVANLMEILKTTYCLDFYSDQERIAVFNYRSKNL